MVYDEVYTLLNYICSPELNDELNWDDQDKEFPATKFKMMVCCANCFNKLDESEKTVDELWWTILRKFSEKGYSYQKSVCPNPEVNIFKNFNNSKF